MKNTKSKINMKKKIIIPIFIFLIVGIVSGFIITNNGYILNKEEMANIGNDAIANYMINNFDIADYKIMENKIIIYYNITYVEPKKTNGKTMYQVFTQYKPFIIEKELWNTCINLTTQANCINLLVNNPEPFIWEKNEEENITITSTYLQAYNEQVRQYYKAIKVRDNAIDNELNYLFENIG